MTKQALEIVLNLERKEYEKLKTQTLRLLASRTTRV